MKKYVCVHGHFYQPPRENPWLESIEPQPSAAPYHDWNERITEECYQPNTASRVLDDEEKIVDITSNYARMSFNFGPTLLTWLEREKPDLYQAILDADKESQRRFNGHGSALAQAYSHVILPLAPARDKTIQVVWGIRDFESRFGRSPEGMWLPETAVDVPTLETLAEHGIRFTILAPHQAARVRPIDGGEWTDVSDARIDPTRAYLQRLPSGAEIALFFYDGPVARSVAFEGLLHRGELLAERILSTLPTDDVPRLAHIATDGESYGHHHRHGDMALAFALRAIEERGTTKLTNYGEFLSLHPPQLEVEIVENTSWSCVHGVERWRSDCGCHTGGLPAWNQSWRLPLRSALEWLRGEAEALFDSEAPRWFRDPERAALEYVELILDRSERRTRVFLDEHRTFDPEGARIKALELLELRRQLQLMFTSCGWFFSDLSGIETIQILQYAARVTQLCERLSGRSVENAFLASLEAARSNKPSEGSGRDIYEKHVRPAKTTWEKLAAHYAISSLFDSYPARAPLYCYEVERERFEAYRAGGMALRIGKIRLTSQLTRASEVLTFGALRLGEHTVAAGVRRYRGQEGFQALSDSLREPFEKADTAKTLRALDEAFGPELFDLKSLFGDEQTRVVETLLRSRVDEAESALKRLYEHLAATRRFLAALSVAPPRALSVAAEVVLNANLRRALQTEPLDEMRIEGLLREAKIEGVVLEEAELAYVARLCLESDAERFFASLDQSCLERLLSRTRLVRQLPFEVGLWKVQNSYFRSLQNDYPGVEVAAMEDAAAKRWVDDFLALGRHLDIRIPEPP